MKNYFILAACICLALSCQKDDIIENEEEVTTGTPATKAKKFTFTVKGDFGAATFTRGYLAADGQDMTDLWAFDYVDGTCVQMVHQTSTDADWGKPTMALTYGSHHVYFVASRGDEPTLSEDAHTITWGTPRDAFWKDYEVEVLNSSNGNRAVTLDRVATKLRLTIQDEVPTGCSAVNVTLDTWYYGLDYVSGAAVTAKKQTRTVSVPASYIGTSGQMAVSIFGVSGADEWVTNVAVTATDAEGKVLGSVNIAGAPFKANRSTEYSGNLFGSAGGLDVSVNASWEQPKTLTW